MGLRLMEVAHVGLGGFSQIIGRMSRWAEHRAAQKAEQPLVKDLQRKRRWIREGRTRVSAQSWETWSV